MDLRAKHQRCGLVCRCRRCGHHYHPVRYSLFRFKRTVVLYSSLFASFPFFPDGRKSHVKQPTRARTLNSLLLTQTSVFIKTYCGVLFVSDRHRKWCTRKNSRAKQKKKKLLFRSDFVNLSSGRGFLIACLHVDKPAQFFCTCFFDTFCLCQYCSTIISLPIL